MRAKYSLVEMEADIYDHYISSSLINPVRMKIYNAIINLKRLTAVKHR